MLNTYQADELFKKNAVLLGGGKDGVTVSRAKELFGENAVNFATYTTTDLCARYHNWYSVHKDGKAHSIHYLTYQGFLRAASYKNAYDLCTPEDCIEDS